MPPAETDSDTAGSAGRREMEYGSLFNRSALGIVRVMLQQSRSSVRATAILREDIEHGGCRVRRFLPKNKTVTEIEVRWLWQEHG